MHRWARNGSRRRTSLAPGVARERRKPFQAQQIDRRSRLGFGRASITSGQPLACFHDRPALFLFWQPSVMNAAAGSPRAKASPFKRAGMALNKLRKVPRLAWLGLYGRASASSAKAHAGVLASLQCRRRRRGRLHQRPGFVDPKGLWVRPVRWTHTPGAGRGQTCA
jgi:hypothetical protein